MNKRIDELLTFTLFPLIDVRGNHYDGIVFKKNDICTNCGKKNCIENAKNKKDYILEECAEKLLFFKVTIWNKTYIIYGLGNGYHSLPRNEKKKYYESKIYFSGINIVKSWVDKVHDNLNKFEEKKDQNEHKNSIFIHDIKKIYSIILRKIESYIKNNCETPKNYDNCLKNADKDIIGIYKSINLLEYQFNIIDFVSNPQSAKFAMPRKVQIYKVIDKLVKIFQSVSDNNIRIVGSSFNELHINDNFITLMFILIDNATKYSHFNQEIEILIEDIEAYNKTKLKVSSYSPYITPAERIDIFEKYERGLAVVNKFPEGQGIGLYVAKIIADTLETKIYVDCDNSINKIDGISYCNVSFEFEVGHI